MKPNFWKQMKNFSVLWERRKRKIRKPLGLQRERIHQNAQLLQGNYCTPMIETLPLVPAKLRYYKKNMSPYRRENPPHQNRRKQRWNTYKKVERTWNLKKNLFIVSYLTGSCLNRMHVRSISTKKGIKGWTLTSSWWPNSKRTKFYSASTKKKMILSPGQTASSKMYTPPSAQSPKNRASN